MRAVESRSGRRSRIVAEIARVLEVDAVLRADVSRDPQGVAAGTFVAGGKARRIATHAARVRQGHHQVDAWPYLEPRRGEVQRRAKEIARRLVELGVVV